MSRSRHRWFRFVAAWLLVAHAAAAQDGLITLDVESVHTSALGNETGFVRSTEVEPFDVSEPVETLVTMPGRAFFGRSGPGPVFSSALARGDFTYGVGVSGITSTNENLRARAELIFVASNPSAEPMILSQEVAIEPIEIAAAYLDGSGEGPDNVTVRIDERITRIAPDGTFGDSELFSSFSIRLEPDAFGGYDADFSDDLVQIVSRTTEAGEAITDFELFDEPDVFGSYDVFGVRVDPFVFAADLLTLEPGEGVEVTFVASAVLNSDPEYGGEAFVGDPFSLGTPGSTPRPWSFALRPVPEPAPWLLLIVGAVASARVSRSRPRGPA